MSKTLLIVDDDSDLVRMLERTMTKRGFTAKTATSCMDASARISAESFDFAIVDLRLADGEGLSVINEIHDANPNCKIVLLSGYANIPSAVAAIKAGAIDCLPKPCDADDIENALLAGVRAKPESPQKSIDPDAIRMAHILNTFRQSGGNISHTARRLGMHRRTLQRILSKMDTSRDFDFRDVVETEKEIIA